MSAEELMKRFKLKKHEENGFYIEKHYKNKESERAKSGSIYYYVSPNELTKFHKIDCDEYWCYIEGSPLEIWQIDLKGNIIKSKLGKEENCEPLIYIKKGNIFASKHYKKEIEGTFLTCITVPRFDYSKFELFEKLEIINKYPQIKEFFNEK